MKILHVEAGRHLYGGALQVVYLVRGLADRGVANIVAAPAGSAILPACASFAQDHPLVWRGDIDLAAVWRLSGVIRRHLPDIVHLHSRRGADVWGLIAARLAGVPAVITRRVDNREPRWLARAKYNAAARVIAISDGIRRVLVEEGIPPDRVAMVRSSVDATAYSEPCDRATFRNLFDLPPGALVIGVVAQLIPRKGHRYLLDVLPPLLADYPDLHVLFFGRGPLEAQFREEVTEPRYDGRVQLAGFREDLPRLLGSLDVLAHPADMEGLGVSLLQAAAAGVPIVASRAGGMPEAVRHEQNGLLVPPGDRVALDAALRRLLDDPALRGRLGAAGRDLVTREFSPDVMVEGTLAVYRDVLRDAGRRAG